MLLGIELENFSPQIRILRIEKLKSQTHKYKMHASINKDNLINFVNLYTDKEIAPYKVSEVKPKNLGNKITPLNRVDYIKHLGRVKNGERDMVIMFFSNEDCGLCEGLWPVIDRAIELF